MAAYEHHWKDGTAIHLPLGKIVCVGRNYAEHAKELNNPIPATPILFIKPATAAVHLTRPLALPQSQGTVHFETELAILIGTPLTNATEDEANRAILGFGLALDLTLRDLQSELKGNGQPWERAKGFDGACPLSPFVAAEHLKQASRLSFSLDLNGCRQQTGDTSDMLNPVLPLLAHISQTFTLLPGDVVLTGTPAGVGPLVSGQKLQFQLEDVLFIGTEVL